MFRGATIYRNLIHSYSTDKDLALDSTLLDYFLLFLFYINLLTIAIILKLIDTPRSALISLDICLSSINIRRNTWRAVMSLRVDGQLMIKFTKVGSKVLIQRFKEMLWQSILIVVILSWLVGRTSLLDIFAAADGN